MLSLKPGVSVFGLRPEMILAVLIVTAVFHEYDVDAVITSATDGKHSSGSLHYAGCAVDFRTRDLPESTRTTLAADVRSALGASYDVVLEDTHLHVEFQPKVGTNN